MKGKELANNAEAFNAVPNFYEYGGWGQEMTRAELDRLAAQHPKNKPVNYGNVGKWGFDCICFIKGLLAGVTVNHHVNSYQEMKSKCPIGDCTNRQFKDALYDRCDPMDAPAGYGLATDTHAALSLGSNRWIDANRTGDQDGVRIHVGIPENFIAGKIPGVDYDEAPQTDEVQEFLAWAYNEWRKANGKH